MDNETESQINQLIPNAAETSVTLDEGITRGDAVIRNVLVKKPKTRALMGLNLTDVLQLNVTALTKILPRITSPALTEAEIQDLDPADLTMLGTAVISFFVTAEQRSQQALTA